MHPGAVTQSVCFTASLWHLTSTCFVMCRYVHRPPGAALLPRLHAFHGHELQGTAKVPNALSYPLTHACAWSFCCTLLMTFSVLQASWGMHSAVTAARALLVTALKVHLLTAARIGVGVEVGFGMVPTRSCRFPWAPSCC